MAGMRCPSCHFENPEGFHFCGSCGCALAPSEPQRRQLTVMFCDLVGSTRLSEQLDPEILRELIGAYREICTSVVHAFGGTVAQFYGDGVEIYFGYPEAHEDDPLRAVCAGLELVAALGAGSAAEGAPPLPARVGIHTGMVVVGELGAGRARDLMPSLGAAPNLAARLQQIAEPGAVLISDETRRLCKGGVYCEPLGSSHLKGFSRPREVFRVVAVEGLGQRPARGRAHATPLVGRDVELGALERAWQACENGHGRVVLVTGDAGIGKTRLVSALESLATTRGGTVIKGHCSAHFQSSALHPVMDMLLARVGLSGVEDVSAPRLAVALGDALPADLAPLLPPLLGDAPGSPGEAPHPLDDALRLRLLDALFGILAHCPADVPTLLVVEDLHWVDPSTAELLARFTREPRQAPLLCVFTARSLGDPGLDDEPHVARIELDGLDRERVSELAMVLTGAHRITPRALDHLHARTDGIPLFVEELVHSLRASGQLEVTDDTVDLAPAAEASPLPASLRDLLTARLDGLGNLKPVAQVASVVGRDFRLPLMAAVTGRDAGAVAADLDALVGAGVMARPHGPSAPLYSFKHALIQEAAYDGLLRARRQSLHARVAAALLDTFPEVTRRHPEIVARHFAAAGTPERAVPYWARAGDLALDRGAHAEATTQFSRALTQLLLEDESPDRDRRELALQLRLAAALRATHGYAAREVEEAYLRADTLCTRLDVTGGLAREHFQARGGLQSVYQLRGPMEEAFESARELLAIAARTGDPVLVAESKRRAGWARFCLGHVREGRELLLEAVAAQDAGTATFAGADPALLARSNLAWTDWFVGYAQRGRDGAESAVAAARRAAPPLTQAYVLCMSAAVHQCCGEPESTRRLAEAAHRLAGGGVMPYWDAWSRVLYGWALAAAGDLKAGIPLVDAAIGRYRETGARLFLPYCLALLADARERAGHPRLALDACREGLEIGADSGARFFEAELRRLEAVLELALGEPATAVESRLWHAIELARRQGAIFLEMRTALSFARVTRSVDVLRNVRSRLRRIGDAA